MHDLAGNDWTNQELIGIVNASRQRVALDLHCVRSFDGGPVSFQASPNNPFNLVPNQEVYPINGGIPGVSITAGGNYTTAPAVTFSAPSTPGGIQATGTAILAPIVAPATSAPVASVQMTNWGTGYVGPPTDTVTFNPMGATGIPSTFIDVLDILSVTFLWPGNTNRTMLNWLPFTTYQAWCRMYTGYMGYPSAWTTHDGSNSLFIFPVPDQAYIMEFDWCTMPTQTLINLTDVDINVLQPFADAVQYYGAFLARTKLQDFDKADYFRKLYNTRTREINATRQDRRIPSPYRSSARRMMRW